MVIFARNLFYWLVYFYINSNISSCKLSMQNLKTLNHLFIGFSLFEG